MLYRDPCVFAVGREYQIAFNTTEFGIAWIEAGGRAYRDSRNGLMRSETLIHKVSIPMDVLNAARTYRVCFRALPERRPYFPELGPLQTKDYPFQPVDFSHDVHAYMLADTHSRIDAPCRAASCFGDQLDLLILNGDIPAESKAAEDIRAIYDITSRVTGGQLPVVFARGNHDYRGRLATELPDYIGTRNGETYFTFRIGCLWGICLDCGEDKDDADAEYGGLVDCHDMRLAETAYLKDVIRRAGEEYLAPGVTLRLAVCHLPFTTKQVEIGDPKFNIEVELFAEWTELLNQLHLDAMLCGHMHRLDIVRPGDAEMRMPANFPVYIGSEPIRPDRPDPKFPGASFVGTALTLTPTSLTCEFTPDNFQ